MNTFAVLGGDLRFVYLAGTLAEDGFSVITAGFDHTDLPHCVTGCTHMAQAMRGADFVVLPLPVPPTTAIIFPRGISKEAWLTASVSAVS